MFVRPPLLFLSQSLRRLQFPLSGSLLLTASFVYRSTTAGDERLKLTAVTQIYGIRASQPPFRFRQFDLVKKSALLAAQPLPLVRLFLKSPPCLLGIAALVDPVA